MKQQPYWVYDNYDEVMRLLLILWNVIIYDEFIFIMFK
jgi:hypothetical protein